MKGELTNQSGTEGRMPAMAPLANPYVPFQLNGAPTYDAKKALIKGTLYPGLELPFMGMVNTKEKEDTPLTQLQALSFALHELSLYLDTHRNDQEALELYRNYQDLYHKGMMAYGNEYGPLTHDTPVTGEYRWLDSPWPWEYRESEER